MSLNGKRVSVYYEKLNEEHRAKGILASPLHVAKENGYVTLIRGDETIMEIPWHRIIRVQEERRTF